MKDTDCFCRPVIWCFVQWTLPRFPRCWCSCWRSVGRRLTAKVLASSSCWTVPPPPEVTRPTWNSRSLTSSSISAICPLLWSRHQIHSSRWGRSYLLCNRHQALLKLKEAEASSISAICLLLWSRHQIHSSRWGRSYLYTTNIRLSSSWKRPNLQASLPSVPSCGQGIGYTAQGETVGILTSGCPQVERGRIFKHLCHLSLVVVSKASDTQLEVRL